MTRQHNYLPNLLQEHRILLLELWEQIPPSQGPCWLPEKVGVAHSSSNEATSEYA